MKQAEHAERAKQAEQLEETRHMDGWIDTHCHLDMDPLAANLPGVLERATGAGVAQIVTIGCVSSIENLRRAIHVAEAHPKHVRATVGVHPHDAQHCDEALCAALSQTATEAAVVAIGETGLDFYYDHSPRAQQSESFRRHIALAKAVRKPLVVHTRAAADETLQILRDEGARDVGGIIHCFSEDTAFAKAALDLGFVSSFSGIVTFRKATAIQDAARRQPDDAILVETDAPFLAPVPHRGKPNEPAFVVHTAAFLAKLRGVSEDTLRQQTTANAQRVFGLVAP